MRFAWLLLIVAFLPGAAASSPLPPPGPTAFYDFDPLTKELRTWADLEAQGLKVNCCLGEPVAYDGERLGWLFQGLHVVRGPSRPVESLPLPELPGDDIYLHMTRHGPAYQLFREPYDGRNTTLYSNDGPYTFIEPLPFPVAYATAGLLAWSDYGKPPRYSVYDLNNGAWVWENRTLQGMGLFAPLDLGLRGVGTHGVHLGVPKQAPRYYVPFDGSIIRELPVPEHMSDTFADHVQVTSGASTVIWSETTWVPACEEMSGGEVTFVIYASANHEASPQKVATPHTVYRSWWGFVSDGRRVLLADYEIPEPCQRDVAEAPGLSGILFGAFLLGAMVVVRTRTR